MLIAKELLEAFRDSFLNLDSEPLQQLRRQNLQSLLHRRVKSSIIEKCWSGRKVAHVISYKTSLF